jgi:hypothetical protein
MTYVHSKQQDVGTPDIVQVLWTGWVSIICYKTQSRRYQGICRNHRDEFTTFYYLFYYLHNIFYYQHDIKQRGGGYAKHHLLLTIRYKCDTAAIPVALVLLLLAPQNNDIESRGLHSRGTRRKIVQRGTKN